LGANVAALGMSRERKVALRRVRGTETWELVHPSCAAERREDLDEIRLMIDAGEFEVARDELLWLLGDCHDLIEAHAMLGELALEEGDVKLARGHFGYAFELGTKALPKEGLRGALPHARPANQAFLEAAKGLAWSFRELGQADRAADVLRQLLALDPSDPLGAAAMLAGLERP
jgi:tetratricopeptide (TPR) repeat protein